MSSTTGSQNLLTNVFRPAYRYEIPVGGSTAVFVPTLDVSNVDVLTANSVTAFTAAIGDENENVYVGSNAGNAYSNLRGCSNNTAVGFSAASFVSNVANSIYIGYNAGAGAADSSVNIAIGPNTKGNGISNIYIGSNTGSLGTGSNNILIGHNLTGSNLSNTLLIGPTPTIYGNLSTRKVGIGRDPSYNMDISGDSRISYRLGVGMAPGTAENVSNLPHALDVSGYSYIKGGLGVNADPADFTFNVNGNFRVADGFGAMILQQDGSGNSVLTCKPDTTDISGRKFVLNVVGDICASAFIVPGATFAGNVTASNVIATADLSGASVRATNIFGTTVFGADVSGTTARFGSLFASSFNPASVTTTTVSVANGSVSTPSITFSNDVSSGVYLPAASNIAFTTAGVERMRISNTHVGIGTAVPRSALDVSTNIRAGTPGNTANTARLEVGGGYVGDGTASTNSYPTLAFQYGDAGGGLRHFIRTRHQPATSSISNALDFFTNNSATAAASTAPGTANLLGLSITSGGVGVGMSNPTVALDVSGAIRSTAATSNSVGGVTLSNTNVTLAGTITGSTANTNNSIGGVTLSNTNLTLAGTITGSTANTNNSIGGVTLSNTSITLAGTITGSTANTNNSIGGVTLSNTNVTLAGTITGSTANTSNVIGGVTLSNNNISNTGTTTTPNIIASGYIRNALTPGTFDISTGLLASNVVLVNNTTGYIRNSATGWTIDISRGNVSNSATHTSSNFIGTATASNSIGGVTLNNGVISNASTTSNNIGGVALDNGVISNGSTTSNNIGGVSLNNGAISNLAASSNNIGGIVLSGNRMVLANGTVSAPSFGFSSDTTTGLYLNAVGGLDFAIAGIRAATFAGGALTTSNDNRFNGPVTAGYVRNALTPSTYDISGGRVRTAVGSVANPAFGFLATDISAGIYLAAANQLGIGVGGTARMLIDNSSIAVGTPGSTGKTALFEIGGGYDSAGAATARSFPAMAFHFGDGTTGGYRHFIRSRHNAASNTPTNSIDIFTNNTNTAEGSSRPGTGNSLAMSIASTGVGVGRLDPVVQFDVSGRVRIRADGSTTNYAFNGGADTLILESTAVYGTTADLGKSATILFGNTVSNYPQARIASEMAAVTPTGFSGNLIFQTGSSTALVERMRIHSNGNIGIATSAPNGALDISGQGATIYVGATSSSTGLIIQGYSNAAYIRPQLTNSLLYLGASNSNTVTISEAYVGINKAPAYALDISASPGTAASININTWPRTTASISYYGVYSAQTPGAAITWTTCNAMNSNLMTTSASNGTNFVIKRNGIYSIQAYFQGTNGGGAPVAMIDVSTVAGHSAIDRTTAPQLAHSTASSVGTSLSVTYTGFLPSNDNNFYKIKMSTIAPGAGYNGGRIYITFLGESPLVAGVPY